MTAHIREAAGLVVLILLAGTSGCAPGGILSPEDDKVWSIGIYEGDSPLHLSPSPSAANPVLTARDVTDVEALFVADPFMVREDGVWFMFFEVYSRASRHGDIGLATSSDGFRWTYLGIVLDEPYSLSYPSVFSWKGEYFMIPEAYESGRLRLYRAENFPRLWTWTANLLEGDFVDPSPFFLDGRIWLFAETNRRGNDTLSFFSAESPLGLWREHPLSPLVRRNPHEARPAGRVVAEEGSLFRFAQDDEPAYGLSVKAFRILKVDAQSYLERIIGPKPVLQGSGSGWNADGMHHIDAHRLENGRWLACVDGWRHRRDF